MPIPLATSTPWTRVSACTPPFPLRSRRRAVRLFDHDDLFARRALSADLTGEAWVSMLGLSEAPVLQPEQAGDAHGASLAS